VEICPEQMFVIDAPDNTPKPTRQQDCILCGHCVSVCPAGALTHKDFPPEDFRPIRVPGNLAKKVKNQG
jgi:NAD-dependent dihydropyrimidine dehydrogenase PreA subunit